ncbi:hypothetical protein KCMC57_up35920 [Kitasatospora sp. CMC57]|uniref:Uncharacterized protein n=1 Tax=Kitasatospora sp. CMC57 TaxID=3231513 RepID=A0AB33K6Z9_9ACTN
MSTNRSRRIDRATAEQLLAGAPGDPSAGQDRLAGRTVSPDHAALAGLIAAAAAPEVGDGDLPGEQAALAAFRAARDQPAAAPRRRSTVAVALSVRARAFSAKALLAAGVATALGGVAVAATTGGLVHLPSALGGSEPEVQVSALPSATAPWSGAPSGQAFDRPSGSPSATARSARPEPSRSSPTGPASPSATAPGAVPGTPVPQPRLEELCRTFTDRLQAGDRAKALAGEPVFAPLVDAAGDPGKVQEYCVRLVGPVTPGGKPSPSRSTKAEPSDGHPSRSGSSGAGEG